MTAPYIKSYKYSKYGYTTERNPIRSAIIRVITKSDDRASEVRFVYLEWLQTELDDTKPYYQFTIKVKISEKSRIAKLWKKRKICIKTLTKETLTF